MTRTSYTLSLLSSDTTSQSYGLWLNDTGLQLQNSRTSVKEIRFASSLNCTCGTVAGWPVLSCICFERTKKGPPSPNNICTGGLRTHTVSPWSLWHEATLAGTWVLNETHICKNNRKTFIILKCVHPTVKKTK